MQKWDYYILDYYEMRLSKGVAQVIRGAMGSTDLDNIDPALNEFEGFVRLAWSPSRKYWTRLQECLDEMGENGWELVGITPSLVRDRSVPDYPHDIHFKISNMSFVFKRPRP